jgi:hypothetical protein
MLPCADGMAPTAAGLVNTLLSAFSTEADGKEVASVLRHVANLCVPAAVGTATTVRDVDAAAITALGAPAVLLPLLLLSVTAAVVLPLSLVKHECVQGIVQHFVLPLWCSPSTRTAAESLSGDVVTAVVVMVTAPTPSQELCVGLKAKPSSCLAVFFGGVGGIPVRGGMADGLCEGDRDPPAEGASVTLRLLVLLAPFAHAFKSTGLLAAPVCIVGAVGAVDKDDEEEK